MDRFFGYAVDQWFVPILLPFGFHRSTDGVTLTESGELAAALGVVRLHTELANVGGAHITRDYHWWTAAGVRRSFADDGLTFGTNARAGVCIHFRTAVPSLLRRKGHSALTVTVEDLDGLVTALTP